MYTQCPHCDSLFEMDQADLALAGGWVCCGVCEQDFNAAEHLSDGLPEAEPEPTTTQTPDSGFIEITLESKDLESDDEPLDIPDAAKNSKSGLANPQRLAELANDLTRPPAKDKLGIWLLASLVLCLLAAMQWGHVHRHQLATHPKFGALVTTLYGFFPADITPLWDPGALRVIKKLDLQFLNANNNDGPSSKLRARISLANIRTNRVPYPNIWLQLDNERNGGVIAQRMFSPQDYAGRDSWVDGKSQLDIVLDLVDPGDAATGFTWDICYPRNEDWQCQFNTK